jgi:hypothetical protein
VTVMLGIAVIVVIVFLLLRSAHPPEQVSSEEELLKLCHGDRSQMERLIAVESKNAPGIPRSVAIARATYSIRRDKR